MRPGDRLACFLADVSHWIADRVSGPCEAYGCVCTWAQLRMESRP